MLKWGGGGGEGEKGDGQNCSPPSVRGPLVFVVDAQKIFSDIFAVSKILAVNSPAGPPSMSCLEEPCAPTITFYGLQYPDPDQPPWARG